LDIITKEATARGSQFNIGLCKSLILGNLLAMNDKSTSDVLDMIHIKLSYQFSLAKKAKLIEALKVW
jgi:hypothetical protein